MHLLVLSRLSCGRPSVLKDRIFLRRLFDLLKLWLPSLQCTKSLPSSIFLSTLLLLSLTAAAPHSGDKNHSIHYKNESICLNSDLFYRESIGICQCHPGSTKTATAETNEGSRLFLQEVPPASRTVTNSSDCTTTKTMRVSECRWTQMWLVLDNSPYLICPSMETAFCLGPFLTALLTAKSNDALIFEPRMSLVPPRKWV